MEHEIDEDKLNKIQCDVDFTPGNHDKNEVKNCVLIYEGLKKLQLYHARDERLWVLLTHTKMLNYCRKRWPIPEDDEKAIQHVKNHYFVNGTRGFERNNAIARLWWMASLCSSVKGLPLYETLTYFLEQYDVRANIIERPNTCQNINVFSAIIQKLKISYKNDKKLFERIIFREFMKEINLVGGIKLLAAMNSDAINSIIDNSVLVAERVIQVNTNV
jgi:hypothetical protein